jgi:autoinducer 2 (AI-2) kinase
LLLDIHEQRWSEKLLELFELSHLDLPELVAPGTSIGTIQPDIAETYQIPPNTWVNLSAADTQCAVIGTEALQDGDVVVVNGSTTPVVMITDTLYADPHLTTWSDIHIDGKSLIESNGGRTGLVYRDVTQLLACQALPEAVPEEIFQVQALNMNASFFPDPGGYVTFHHILQTVCFQGDITDFLKHLPYLLLENNAFSIAGKIRELVRVRGSETGRIYLTGGSSRSVLTQTILSALHRTTDVYLTSTYDTTTRGAMLLTLQECSADKRAVPIADKPTKLCHDQLSLDGNYRREDFSDLVHERFRQWQQTFTTGCSAKDVS